MINLDAVMVEVGDIATDNGKVKITVKGVQKTLFVGIGNMSGLHSFGKELLNKKWITSKDRIRRKLEKLPEFSLEFFYQYQETRDRVKYNSVGTKTYK